MSLFLARIYVGEALLNGASLLARTGRLILGSPVVMLTEAVRPKASVLKVNQSVPRFAQGIRLEANGAYEIVRIKKVSPDGVEIDRPLAQGYPAGSVAKVLL